MTWAKFGVEYRGQLMVAGLSDAAARTHTDALLWLYEIESADLRILKPLLRTIAGTADYEQAAKELAAAGFWRNDGDAWVIVHHAAVYRQSLAAQLTHREKERDRQRAKRQAKSSVGANVGATQTDRHTDNQQRQEQPPVDGQCVACDRPARRACRTCWEHASREFA